MKTMKTKFFALAFLALGITAGITSCGKDEPDDEKVDFAGTYHGEYSILGLLNVPDTLTVTNTGDNTISIFSVKLDTSFTATVSGSTATFNGFTAPTFSTESITLTGIDVKSGKGTLKNNTDLTVVLEGVNVENAAGDVPEPLKKVFPIKNQRITTAKTFKKQ